MILNVQAKKEKGVNQRDSIASDHQEGDVDASDAIGEHEPMDELPPASANSMSTQTDSTRVNHLESDDAAALRHELQELKMRPHVLTADLFKKTDEMVKFYTGLPNWSVFDAVMPLITPCFPSSKNGKLSIFQK